MKETEAIARAVLSVFQQQARLARGGKDRFGDWHARLSQAILDPIAALYLKGAKKGGATKDDVDDVATAARERSLLTARMINDTTGEWLREGRELPVVFSPERAVMVAETETVNALNYGRAIVVQARGGKLKWVVGKSPCKTCRRLNGKVVKAGKPFAIVEGKPVFAPPLHPNCNCGISEVVE